eukprot:TRINITY_DN7964_c0_g1_i1.p1 TRINITY_DN7964_c0_g1~~TRINITY_DN7964_c0_g1_i1.p1  ORF type:complete len:178 (-),score=34.45 TRINITY_DN7964_c0_g1_i1:438-971(-)
MTNIVSIKQASKQTGIHQQETGSKERYRNRAKREDLFVLLDEFTEALLVGSAEGLEDAFPGVLSIDEADEDKGGHGRDAKLLSDGGELVHIDLEEDDVLKLLGHALEGGGDALAGAAPGGEEVDHDQLRAGGGGKVGEGSLVGDDDHCVCVLVCEKRRAMSRRNNYKQSGKIDNSRR